MENAILIVDDEQSIVNSLNRIFRREGYRIFTALSGKDGLEIVRNNRVSVVISDQRMPVMDGVEFLSKVKEASPDTVRFMLTGHAEFGSVVGAINKGEVTRFITKPWDDAVLMETVREAMERFNLVAENRRLFELTKKQNAELADLNANLEARVVAKTRTIRENFFSFVRIFADVMELYDDHVGGHSKRVAMMARRVAEMLYITGADADLIETAALLHNIGMVGVPKELLDKDMHCLGANERALLMNNPVLSQDLLSKIDNLRQAGVIIRSYGERYDGTGYPDRLRGEELHIGARIIAVCKLYDRLRHSKARMSVLDIVERIKSEAGTNLDPAVVQVFIEFLKEWKDGPAPDADKQLYEVVPVHEMRPGMVLARNILTGKGRLLVTKGTILTVPLIDKVVRFNDIDPIIEGICVEAGGAKV